MTNQYSIVLPGKVPSKKNNKDRVWANGKPYMIPGKVHKKWEDEQIKLLGEVLPVPFSAPYAIEVVIYAGDKRRGDLSNKVESVNDLLVKLGIIPDDNWFELSTLIVKFGGVDRGNPRAEVTITPAITEVAA